MKFSKNKIIAGILIIFVLGLTFWYGGNAPGLQGWNSKPGASKPTEDILVDSQIDDSDIEENIIEKADQQEAAEENKNETDKENSEQVKENKKELEEDEVEQTEEIHEEEKEELKNKIKSRPGGGDEKLSPSEKTELAKKIAKDSSKVDESSESYSGLQGMDIDSSTGKDKYLTDPVPEGKPVPIEPENSKITDVKKHCTLSVRCDTILDNIEWLDPEKVELVPEDGVIYARKEVMFYEGESVFNLLWREMKRSKIHMEFTNTPIYNSAYIQGINNLYEFDCGELSGWMYKVNDWFPNYGASRYALKEGDKVEWVYTCELGVDVGGFSAIGGE